MITPMAWPDHPVVQQQASSSPASAACRARSRTAASSSPACSASSIAVNWCRGVSGVRRGGVEVDRADHLVVDVDRRGDHPAHAELAGARRPGRPARLAGQVVGEDHLAAADRAHRRRVRRRAAGRPARPAAASEAATPAGSPARRAVNPHQRTPATASRAIRTSAVSASSKSVRAISPAVSSRSRAGGFQHAEGLAPPAPACRGSPVRSLRAATVPGTGRRRHPVSSSALSRLERPAPTTPRNLGRNRRKSGPLPRAERAGQGPRGRRQREPRAEPPPDRGDQPVQLGAERVVVHQVRPGGGGPDQLRGVRLPVLVELGLVEGGDGARLDLRDQRR